MAGPTCSEEETGLLTRASAFSGLTDLPSLTAEKLRETAEREGVDFATALLYDRVRHSPQHSQFISRIDQLQSPASKKSAGRDVIIAVVPAAFYREKPNSGADGRLVREEAVRLGLRCELVPVSSTGTLAQNAQIILDWLAKHGGETIIVVSLCKGGADVKFALGSNNSPGCFKNVLAWVNICGTLNGSPVAAWLLATKPRVFLAWLYCKCKGHNLAFLHELVPSLQSPLATPVKLPPFMQMVNVIGFPLQQHLTNRFMRMCHQRVSSQGPNDGGVLLADACHLPGVIYPVWGADHYLRPEARSRRIIAVILEYLTEDNRPAHGSANEIPASGQIVQTPWA